MTNLQPYQQSILKFFKEGEKLDFYQRETKNNMKTAHFQYKCRRCGEIKESPRVDHAMHRLVNAIYECKRSNLQAPELFSTHSCKDGGIGVGDLIGYSVSE